MIGRWILFGTTSWCFLIGVWRHDWKLIIVSLALFAIFAVVAEEIHRDV